MIILYHSKNKLSQKNIFSHKKNFIQKKLLLQKILISTRVSLIFFFEKKYKIWGFLGVKEKFGHKNCCEKDLFFYSIFFFGDRVERKIIYVPL